MTRKIIAGILVAFSSIFLGLSLAGIMIIWGYRQPFTQAGMDGLKQADSELALVQTVLQTTQTELGRALQIFNLTEKALAELNIHGAPDQPGIPDLASSQERINQMKSSLLTFRGTLEQINSLPFLSISPPTKTALEELIANTATLDAEIAQVEGLIQKAATFINDSSNLLGGNFADTKRNLQNFLQTTKIYDQKISGWRTQVAWLLGALPGWVNITCVGLTAFLIWFGFSQLGLLRRELYILRGAPPLENGIQQETVMDYEI